MSLMATFFLLHYRCVTVAQGGGGVGGEGWGEQSRLSPRSGSSACPTGLFKKLKAYTATSQGGKLTHTFAHAHTHTHTHTHTQGGDKELLKGT